MVSFECTREEYRTIGKIVQRAMKMAAARGLELGDEPEFQRTLDMDITACHANGCRLDLDKLLAAPDGDFGHDVFGIRRYIDRKTGELTDCFLPRCAKQ